MAHNHTVTYWNALVTLRSLLFRSACSGAADSGPHQGLCCCNGPLMQDNDSKSCVSSVAADWRGAGSSVSIAQACLGSVNAACRIALTAAGRLLFWLTSKQTSWRTRSQTFQMQQQSLSAASGLSLCQPFASAGTGLSRPDVLTCSCCRPGQMQVSSCPGGPGRGLRRLVSTICSGRCPTCSDCHAGQGRAKASQQQLVQRSPSQAGASRGRLPLPITLARQHPSKM